MSYLLFRDNCATQETQECSNNLDLTDSVEFSLFANFEGSPVTREDWWTLLVSESYSFLFFKFRSFSRVLAVYLWFGVQIRFRLVEEQADPVHKS